MADPPAPGRGLPAWLSPVWLVVAAIISVQVGASLAKSLFGSTSEVAITLVRLGAAAIILWLVARPRLSNRSIAEWRAVLGYGLTLAVMNASIYLAFARIPIGLAVTIEFLGPLSLALLGSRRPRDLLWVGLAGAGVAMLGVFPASVDWLGVGFALLAGAAWAGYILLSGPTGRYWEGVTGVSVGSAVGALLLLAPGLILGQASLWQPWVLGVGTLVAVLSSVIPYGLEMVALRSIPAGVFGILMSLEPAAAAVSAFLILGEQLSVIEVVAMVCVIAASIGSTRALTQAPAPN